MAKYSKADTEKYKKAKAQQKKTAEYYAAKAKEDPNDFRAASSARIHQGRLREMSTIDKYFAWLKRD